MLFFIETILIQNFANDKTLSAWVHSVPGLVSKLEIASKNAIDWFKLNKMIVNSE